MGNQNNKPKYISILLEVEGMKCGGCLNTVEKTLLDQENVKSASVNLVERTALIDLKDENGSIESILSALANRGFPSKQKESTTLNNERDLIRSKKWWSQWNQLMIALVLLLL